MKIKLPYPESRRPGVWMSIAVGVATHVIGTLVVRVVDGIVKEIESQPGWWVSEAARQVLDKPFVDNISIDCNVYPLIPMRARCVERFKLNGKRF